MKHAGLFALMIGILGQLISLFMAFKAIELGTVEVSTSLIISGFEISLIPTSYGLLIFLFTLSVTYGLKKVYNRS